MVCFYTLEFLIIKDGGWQKMTKYVENTNFVPIQDSKAILDTVDFLGSIVEGGCLWPSSDHYDNMIMSSGKEQEQFSSLYHPIPDDTHREV